MTKIPFVRGIVRSRPPNAICFPFELKAFSTKYEVIGTSVWNGEVSQLWLQLPLLDREFQREYEKGLPGCHTRMVFGKDL
jgi:hypothetical protein